MYYTVGGGILVVTTDLTQVLTQVLTQIEQGDPSGVELLLPYEELRKLAAQNRIHLGNIG